MADKKFGETIQRLRKQKGLTQSELAELLGLKNKSTLGSWEVGKSEPDARMIIKLCKVFEIDANTLFEMEDDTPIARPDDFWIIDGRVIHYRDMPDEAKAEFEMFLRLLKKAYNL